MIDIAIPPILRRDARIRRLLSEVKSGKPGALDELYQRLVDDIPDARVRELLRDHRAHDPDAKIHLRVHLEQSLSGLVKQYLYPTRSGTPMTGEEYEENLTLATESWASLIEVVRRSAERLWRDEFLMDTSVVSAGRRLGRKLRFWSTSTTDRDALDQVTFNSWLLMLLNVETSLYAIRSNSNYQSREGVQIQHERWWRGQTTRRQVAQVIKAYQRRLRRWDRELYHVTGRHFFRRKLGDSQRLRALSKTFGPDGVDVQAELGWVTQATDAGDELRYRAVDIHRSESTRSGHPIVALWLSIQKLTTGYGTRPGRFVRTSLLVIVTFGILFFANDYLNPGLRTSARYCPAVDFSHTPWWQVVIHYLYITVTNLTSLGSNVALAPYCGGVVTELLLVAASLTGYFLLATLAALFYQQIREAHG